MESRSTSLSTKNLWITIGLAAASALALGGAALWTTRYLKADHERTVLLRAAQKRFKQLLSELNECKGMLKYIEGTEIPRIKELSKKAAVISASASGEEAEGAATATEDDKSGRLELERIRREILGVGEHVLSLMEKIDGVAPAHILDDAGLDPWTESDEKLKQQAVDSGLGPVFDLTADLRAIRKGLVRKAERTAQKIDSIKNATFSE